MFSLAAITLIVNVLTSALKWMQAKLGGSAVHAVVFVLALVGALYLQYHTMYPTFTHYIETTGVVFSAAVALYEVLLSKIPFFQGPTTSVFPG